jgi:hypothetical protein
LEECESDDGGEVVPLEGKGKVVVQDVEEVEEDLAEENPAEEDPAETSGEEEFVPAE